MANLDGPRYTTGITQATRAIDMVAAVKELEPNAAPLTSLVSRIPAAPTDQTQFSWVENELQARFDAINNGAGYTNSDTSIVVDAGAKFHSWDLVKNTRTGEVFRVTAVATNTLTVVRGVGGGAAAMLDNDEVLLIGSAEKEGADVKTPYSSNPTVVNNYVQIVRRPFAATETLMHTRSWNTPGEWERAANLAGVEHKKDWEYIYWMGKASEVAQSDGLPVRTTAGVFNYISTNVTDVGGAMTEDEFYGTYRAAFRYGNTKVKTLFASALFVEIINKYPKSKLELVQSDNDTSYGLDVRRFVSPHGSLNVITHWLFEGAKYGGYGAILDLSQIRRRPLRGRDTMILRDRQGPGMDTKMDEYLTESGLEFGLEKTHALVINATS